MRIKVIFLAAITLLTAVQVSAQWSVGVQGGATCNTLNTDNGYAYDRHYTSKWGATFGIPVRYDFNSWFGLQSEVSVTYKNYGIERSWAYASNYYDFTNTYLDIPVMARFKFGSEKIYGYALAGAYVGAWLNSHIKGAQMRYFDQSEENEEHFGGYKFDETYEFDSRRDNRFDAGITAGLGVQYAINSRFGVFGEVRYSYGLTDTQKDYMRNKFPRYNNTLALQIGVTYTFKRK